MIDAFLLICSFCVNNKKLKKVNKSCGFFKSIIFAHVIENVFFEDMLFIINYLCFICVKKIHKLAFLLDIFL